jgi:hypothetical protein
MSQQNPIRVFVTHCWQDSDDYSRLFEYFESTHKFFYRNTSTPDSPPSSGATEAVRADLRKQIDAAEVVVALGGLYRLQPDLTIFQMNYAQSQNKPVLLLLPFGSAEEPPKLLAERADERVGWEGRGLVDAIKRLGRQENTERYETIEFNPADFPDFRRD